MQNVLYVEISIIGVCLLLIILFNQHQNIGSSNLQRLFNLLIYSTIAMLMTDAACWLLDGAAFPYARALKTAAETLYFGLNTLIPYLWVVYVEFSLRKEQEATHRRLRMLAVLPVLLFLFVLVNLYTNSIFFIDENNVYHRNSGLYVFTAATYAYLGYASIRALTAAHHATWKEDKRRYEAMAFFTVLPAIGGIIQIFIYGVSLIWVFVAISILLIYIHSLNQQISTDPLTGINNRRELDRYLLRETKEPRDEGVLALIMMDVDGFKEINDTQGHYYGDGVLVAVSEILKQACKNSPAFLARYGGDEFCIVFPAKDTAAVEKMIDRIQTKVNRWNKEHKEPVSLVLSIGYSVWQPETDKNVEALYKQAGQKMYREKSAKKIA